MISGGPGKTGRFSRIVAPAAILAGLLLCCIAMPAAGESVLTISARQQLELADILFDRSEYEGAITEYRRFSHFFPDHPEAGYAAFRIALACYHREEFEKALSLFESICGDMAGNRYAVEACFMVSRCQQSLGRMEPAEAVLQTLAAATDDGDVRDRAWYHIGWLCLESGASLEPAAISRAGEYFARVSDRNQDAYRVGSLTERLGARRSSWERKSPGLSGALAVFPGAGYVYCGRYRDALMSFLFIGGMGCAAGEAFSNDLEGLGALIGAVGSGFYAGSIYGSVTAAHKWNRARSREFLDHLREIRVDAAPAAQGHGVMVRLRSSF